jgi:hypothetical protein
MGDLAGIAERLRVVKLAQRRFLRLWDIERALIDPLIERVAAELDGPSCGAEDVDAEPLAGTATAIKDGSHPRPALDRGRRLDDED